MEGLQLDQGSSSNQDSASLVVTTSASHHTQANDLAVENLLPTTVIRAGGAGYKATLVMERKADVYVYPVNPCDHHCYHLNFEGLHV